MLTSAVLTVWRVWEKLTYRECKEKNFNVDLPPLGVNIAEEHPGTQYLNTRIILLLLLLLLCATVKGECSKQCIYIWKNSVYITGLDIDRN